MRTVLSGIVLRNWEIVLALVLLFLEGVFMSQEDTYLWWYLEELGARPAMIYIVSFTSVVTEVYAVNLSISKIL